MTTPVANRQNRVADIFNQLALIPDRPTEDDMDIFCPLIRELTQLGEHLAAHQFLMGKQMSPVDKSLCFQDIVYGLLGKNDWDTAIEVTNIFPDQSTKSLTIVTICKQLTQAKQFEKAIQVATFIPDKYLYIRHTALRCLAPMQKMTFARCCIAAKAKMNPATALQRFLDHRLHDKHLVTLIGKFL